MKFSKRKTRLECIYVLQEVTKLKKLEEVQQLFSLVSEPDYGSWLVYSESLIELGNPTEALKIPGNSTYLLLPF